MTMPNAPNVPPFTFGVELEVLMPRENRANEGRTALARHLADHDILARAEGWNHENRPYWKLTTDGTIGYDNTEIVSPILSGQEGLDQITSLCSQINRFGCSVDRRCGFHVHVGVRPQFTQRVGVFKELLRTYHRYDTLIDQLMAPSRRGVGNQWCLPPVYNDRVESASTLDELRTICGGKYRKIGVDSYWRHGTVEFRHHQGTTNGEKVIAWVMFCLHMMQHAAKNTEASGVSRTPPPPDYRSTPVERDVMRGTALRGSQVPRFTRDNAWQLRDLVITRVATYNPHRSGTQSYRDWEATRAAAIGAHTAPPFHTVDMYRRSGGTRGNLTWYMDNLYITVVRRSDCPPVQAATTETQSVQPPPAPEAPVVVRPPTDQAPLTLTGLFDLIELPMQHQNYFYERQLELNR